MPTTTTSTRAAACAALALIALAAPPSPAAAQERSDRFSGTTREAGLADGALEAERATTRGWAFGGALATLVAGAWGAVPAVGITLVARPSMSREARRAIADQPRVYREGFGDAFDRAVKRKRATAALIGAAVGVAVHYFVVAPLGG
jgi:hypothetical protein